MSKEIEWLRSIKKKGVTHHAVTEDAHDVESLVFEEVDVPADAPVVQKKGDGFSAIAGMDKLKRLVKEGFINVLMNPEKAEQYGISVPNILLYGPPGCGKTYFAEKMAEEIGINFMKIGPDDLSSTFVHGTQKRIGEIFHKAEVQAPTLLFLDEFDCMVPKRSGDPNRQYMTDEVDEFLTVLNDTAKRGVYVIAATNHPENIDSSVLRTGRIDEKIYVPMPDKEARENLFRHELKARPQADDICYEDLATQTEGYNCSDISYIVKAAARSKFNLAISSAKVERIGQEDLMAVIKNLTPSVNEKDLRAMADICKMFSPKEQMRARYSIGFN